MNSLKYPGATEANQILDQLQKKNNILIISHPNPDGDSIGSSLALSRLLLKMGKNSNVVVPNGIPSYLLWLPGASEVIVYESHAHKAEKIIQEAEIVFFIDFNSINRLNNIGKYFEQGNKTFILIDHHLQPADIFDVVFHTTQVSSTSELIYDFIVKAGLKEWMDKEIATCLYTGIMTDTGSFSYSCNHPQTYHVTAELISLGINVSQIHNLVYDTFSEDRMRLLGHLLLNCMVVNHDLHTAYLYLSLTDQKRFNFQPGDSEGFVNYALSIKGIRFAAFFTEKENLIRISFRSKGNFSVNNFARIHFDGGGHLNASGANSYRPLKDTLELFESLLPAYADELCKEDY
ncbi:MAG: bifunctional oligoribonuclease and phosphatase NrnA [Bacteroidales bacterium]|jgi:phosphoesterase RecJ-like protein|nr:bifunctional oligoribonuclease and phosphatase NrnA [Bacteroidales bacterium]MDN5329759.1 bifunctional oligoribonuclease and phosphatase NrnA [Bacteroidales bacterium]